MPFHAHPPPSIPSTHLLTNQQITEILYDCDNTLVLSEELAFAACADLANEILEKQKISARYTGADLLSEFVGQNFRGMLLSLQNKHDFALLQAELDSYVSQEEDRVIAKIEAEGKPCINCTPELQKVHDSGKYGMAVVSSSALRRVNASLVKVDQKRFFPDNGPHATVFSAATSLPTPTSKPDPAIYLHACKIVGKKPGECVAVEDSKSGATSAVRAGIPVIGYVGSYPPGKKQKQIKEMMGGLGVSVVMEDWKEFAGCLERIEKM